MVIRGWSVSFIATNGDLLTLPVPNVIVQDPEGETIRRCTVYMVRPLGPGSLKRVSEYAQRETRKWHDSPKLVGVEFEVPGDDWVRLRRVAEIWYHAIGTHGRVEHRRHPYDGGPQWLSEHRVDPAWKVRLPDGCLIDHLGFRYP